MNRRILALFFVFVIAMFMVWQTAVITAVSAQPKEPSGKSSVYGTFLGGQLADAGYGIALGEDGGVYVVGDTQSTSFPTATLSAPLHGIDVFATKFNAAGSDLEYSLWFNALAFGQEDYAYDVAVDGDGSAYVVGRTRSDDFCDVFGDDVPGYQPEYRGVEDAFVLKINPDGGGLAYCTYIGGTEGDAGRGLAIAPDGGVYVVGDTWSADFPTTPHAVSVHNQGERDIFIVKIDPTGTILEYGSYLGGSEQELGADIALDGDNNIYLTGWTKSSDLYTQTAVFDPVYGGAFDAFLFKISADDGQIVYNSYIGGGDEDRGTGVDVSADGRVYLTGYTRSSDLPTTPDAFAPAPFGGRDAYALALTPTGDSLLYGTYLGGRNDDYGYALDVDRFGLVYLTGETYSADFPVSDSGSRLSGDRDAFAAQLNGAGADLLYSVYLGGRDWESGRGVVTDGNGNAYLTGQTNSADFPTTPGAYDMTHNGDHDVYVAVLPMVDLTLPLTAVAVSGAMEAVAGEETAFTAVASPISATLPITYVWQAEDQAVVTHTVGLSDTAVFSWTTSGVKTITTTALNRHNAATATHTITIVERPSADFTAVPREGTLPLTVQFTNTTQGAYDTLLWEFGDGMTGTVEYPAHLYTQTGIYTVTLTATGGGGTDTAVKPAYITVIPHFIYLPAMFR